MGKRGVLIYRCRQCGEEGERRTKDVDDAIADILLHRKRVSYIPVTGDRPAGEDSLLEDDLREFQPPRIRHTDCLGEGSHGIADVVGCRVVEWKGDGRCPDPLLADLTGKTWSPSPETLPP